ncbi:MAG: ribonuclease P protein component, partial [Pseudomonadota bacterium]
MLPETTDMSGRHSLHIEKLPARKDFLRLRSGSRYSTSTLTLQAKANTAVQNCRVGYTVTTKVGSAVVR